MKSTLIVGIVPTFHLKKVDPLEVYQRLIKGDFKSIVKNVRSAQPIESREINVYGSNSDDASFTFKDHNNLLQVIVSSNHNDRKTCDWCKQSIPDDSIIIGVPISYAFQAGNHIIDMEGCCHSFECAFSYLKRFRGYHVSTFDPIYANSETILRFLFSLCYPGETLKDAMDPRIYKQMGGSVSNIKHHSYVRLPSVVIQKAKVLYQKS